MPTVVLRQNAEQDRELRVIYKNAYDKIKEYLYTDKIADDIYYCHFTKQRNICPLFIFGFFHKKKPTSFLILAVCDAANFTPSDTVCKCISQN